MVHVENLVQVFHRDHILDQHDQHGLVVCQVVIIRHPDPLPTGVRAPLADRPELAPLHHRLRFVTAVDVRYHDAHGPEVETAIDDAPLVLVHADDGRGADQVDGARQVGQVGKAYVAVLTLQPDAVRLRRRKTLQVVGAAVTPGRKAQGVLTLAQSIFHPIRAYDHSGSPLYKIKGRWVIICEQANGRLRDAPSVTAHSRRLPRGQRGFGFRSNAAWRSKEVTHPTKWKASHDSITSFGVTICTLAGVGWAPDAAWRK